MKDLFTDIPEEKKTRKFYKDKKGQFTDKNTAIFHQTQKERDKLKVGFEYYKRQCERLSRDFREEHEKVLKLKSIIEQLTSKEN